MTQVDLDPLFDHHPYAQYILEKLSEVGYQAVIVGGAIRDLLRGTLEDDYSFSPADTDIDIATSAHTSEVKKHFPKFDFVEVGKRFGVLIVIAPDDQQYEIAHFRSESDYDGRHPGEVKLVNSLKKDVSRRDFTVNGLAVTRQGEVIDYVNGIEDLRKKIIRAIGNPIDRFQEDYLRPLRAIRIYCDIGGEIDPDTYHAIERVAKNIRTISWERIKTELFNILATSNSATGLRLCKDTGLLPEILPEMAKNEGIPQPEKYHPEGDVLEHSFQALEVADKLNYPPLIKLAIFIHDVGKAQAYSHNDKQHLGGHELIGKKLTAEITSRLRLSNKEADKIEWIVGNHMRASILHKMRKAKQVKLVRHNQDKDYSIDEPQNRFHYFFGLLQTVIADSEASAHKEKGWLPAVDQFSNLLPHLQELENLGTARKLINGNDLKRLGMEEGPHLGDVLKEVHELIYAGKIDSHDEALAVAKQKIN